MRKTPGTVPFNALDTRPLNTWSGTKTKVSIQREAEQTGAERQADMWQRKVYHTADTSDSYGRIRTVISVCRILGDTARITRLREQRGTKWEGV